MFVARATACVLFCLAASPLGTCAQPSTVQYQGGIDAAAVVGTRSAHGGLLSADLEVPLCESADTCAWALGGVMQAGFGSANQDVDSRVWMMLGPTVAWRSQRNPFVEFAIDVGGWAGGRDEGLDAGYYLGVRSFFGLQVSDTAAIGLRLGAGLYGGARDWLTFQPGLALRWSLEQGP